MSHLHLGEQPSRTLTLSKVHTHQKNKYFRMHASFSNLISKLAVRCVRLLPAANSTIQLKWKSRSKYTKICWLFQLPNKKTMLFTIHLIPKTRCTLCVPIYQLKTQEKINYTHFVVCSMTVVIQIKSFWRKIDWKFFWQKFELRIFF